MSTIHGQTWRSSKASKRTRFIMLPLLKLQNAPTGRSRPAKMSRMTTHILHFDRSQEPSSRPPTHTYHLIPSLWVPPQKASTGWHWTTDAAAIKHASYCRNPGSRKKQRNSDATYKTRYHLGQANGCHVWYERHGGLFRPVVLEEMNDPIPRKKRKCKKES